VISLINFIILLSLSTFVVNLASSLNLFKNDIEDYLTLKMNSKLKIKTNPDQESGLMDI
jgi:hypothetical protein